MYPKKIPVKNPGPRIKPPDCFYRYSPEIIPVKKSGGFIRGPPSGGFKIPQPSGTSFFDSSYSAGQLVAELPTSRNTAEAKAILNDTIDRREREQDMRDNATAQLEIMELAKPWLKDFPHHCIPQDNYQMFDLEDQRNMVEHDLNCLTSSVALDGTPLDPDVDREDLYHTLNARYNNLNRAMYTVFANTLQLSEVSRVSRKRRASASPQTSPEEILDETNTCPYVHIKDEPAAPKTSPHFDPLPDPLPEVKAPNSESSQDQLAVQRETVTDQHEPFGGNQANLAQSVWEPLVSEMFPNRHKLCLTKQANLALQLCRIRAHHTSWCGNPMHISCMMCAFPIHRFHLMQS